MEKGALGELEGKGFLSLVVETIAEGLFTINARGEVTSWNKAMERISGYRCEEILGTHCNIIDFQGCSGEECPKDPAECRIFENGKVDSLECLLRHKTGRLVPVLKNARVLREADGSILGAVETVTDLTELTQARSEVERAERKLRKAHRFHRLVGKSAPMQGLFALIRKAAATDVTVLIQGESGTGKELVAGAIHYNSARSRSPLVAVNCAALPETLLESELFGHVRGAFTGAVNERVGRFEEARGGSVFLDEIGEMSIGGQAKLLRVLEEHAVERLGESRKRRIDARILSASHRDLFALVGEKKFRQDLYYRLNVLPVRIPPLRERKEDIPLLADHFLQSLTRKMKKGETKVSQKAMKALLDYSWPGNVRELKNAMERAMVVASGSEISMGDLPREIVSCSGCLAPAALPSRRRRSLDRESLVRLLEECSWNKAEVARRIGLSRASVWKYMKKWSIERDES